MMKFKSHITTKELIDLFSQEQKEPINRKIYMVSQDGDCDTYSVTTLKLMSIYDSFNSNNGTFSVKYPTCCVDYCIEEDAIIFIDRDEAYEYAKYANMQIFKAFFTSAQLDNFIIKETAIKSLIDLMNDLKKNDEQEKALGVYKALRTIVNQKSMFESTESNLYIKSNKYVKLC